jgi:hypothetical protein
MTRSGKTYRHCSLICAELDMELTGTRQLCEVLGSSPLSTELWTNLVEVSDRWSDVAPRCRMSAHRLVLVVERQAFRQFL